MLHMLSFYANRRIVLVNIGIGVYQYIFIGRANFARL